MLGYQHLETRPIDIYLWEDSSRETIPASKVRSKNGQSVVQRLLQLARELVRSGIRDWVGSQGVVITR